MPIVPSLAVQENHMWQWLDFLLACLDNKSATELSTLEIELPWVKLAWGMPISTGDISSTKKSGTMFPLDDWCYTLSSYCLSGWIHGDPEACPRSDWELNTLLWALKDLCSFTCCQFHELWIALYCHTSLQPVREASGLTTCLRMGNESSGTPDVRNVLSHQKCADMYSWLMGMSVFLCSTRLSPSHAKHICRGHSTGRPNGRILAATGSMPWRSNGSLKYSQLP